MHENFVLIVFRQFIFDFSLYLAQDERDYKKKLTKEMRLKKEKERETEKKKNNVVYS